MSEITNNSMTNDVFPPESDRFNGISLSVAREVAPGKQLDSYFHYTSAAGLKGIVENNSLFFSDTKFVNDGSERRWGLEVFREVIDRMSLTLNERSSTFLEMMYDE